MARVVAYGRSLIYDGLTYDFSVMMYKSDMYQ